MKYEGRVFDGYEIHESSEISFSEITGKIEYLEDRRNKGIEDVTFLPGLIDTHIHFFGTESYSLMDWVLTSDVLLTIKSVNDARTLLEAGYTTVRTLGDKVSLGLSKAERSGLLYGPRIISAGYSLAETGGNDDPKALPFDLAKSVSYSYYCDGPWECRKAVRINLRNGAEATKAYSSRSFVGGGRIKNEFTVEELKAIADESHNASIKATSHAYGESAIGNTVAAGFDSIEHGLGLTEDLAEAMRRNNMFYVPTMSVYKRKREDVNPFRDEMIKRHVEKEIKLAYDSGIKIATGTDYVGSLNEPHGMNYQEIVYLSEVIGTLDALRSATSVAADCVGIADTGKVKEGFNADIIAVKGDPIKNPRCLVPDNIVLVVKHGKIVKNLLKNF